MKLKFNYRLKIKLTPTSNSYAINSMQVGPDRISFNMFSFLWSMVMGLSGLEGARTSTFMMVG